MKRCSERLLAATLAWTCLTAAAVDLVIERPQLSDTQDCLCSKLKIVSGLGEEVAGLQFDLTWDPAQVEYKEISVGPAAEKAHKDLHVNQLDKQTVRVVMAGINQFAIADGVIADACLTSHQLDARLDSTFDLERVIMSDPFGSPLQARIITVGADGARAVTGGTGTLVNVGQKLAWAIVAGAVLLVLSVTMRTPKKRRYRSVKR